METKSSTKQRKKDPHIFTPIPYLFCLLRPQQSLLSRAIERSPSPFQRSRAYESTLWLCGLTGYYLPNRSQIEVCCNNCSYLCSYAAEPLFSVTLSRLSPPRGRWKDKFVSGFERTTLFGWLQTFQVTASRGVLSCVLSCVRT